MATMQATKGPLWKSGSHVRSRTIKPLTECSPDEELNKWFDQHPVTPNTPKVDDIPAGEIFLKTSGVFGVYSIMPQATCRLLQSMVDSDKERSATAKHRVVQSDQSNRLLRNALAIPIQTHRFL